MKVILDERERDLFSNCYRIVESSNLYTSIYKDVLPLGDVFIKTDEDKHVILIERKTILDLLASIKDKRYEEQSYRLIHASGLPPHSIVYLIEGSLSDLRTPLEKKIFYSALTSLNYFKGFSVIRTMNVKESAEYIIYLSEKIERNFLKCIFPYYLQPQFCKFMQKPVIDKNEPDLNELENEVCEIKNENQNSENVLRELENKDENNDNVLIENNEIPNYCTVVKKVKKDNITPENIGEILLCQIPSISSVSAISIMKKFSTISNLIKELEKNQDCLNDIYCETKGKSRKLGKNCIDNIKKYLL